MKVKAMALWGLLWFVDYLEIQHINIYGDSQAIINHAFGSSHVSHPRLQGWLHHIKCLHDSLQGVTYQHLHRAHNKIFDALSKLGLLDPLEGFYISLGANGDLLDVGHMSFP